MNLYRLGLTALLTLALIFAGNAILTSFETSVNNVRHRTDTIDEEKDHEQPDRVSESKH